MATEEYQGWEVFSFNDYLIFFIRDLIFNNSLL